jgi:K+-sensing histidine kinase KdpD
VSAILTRTAAFKVSLGQQEKSAVSRLMKFVGESCGMQYAALRRLEPDGSLEWIDAHGFEGMENARAIDLRDLDDSYPTFGYVVESGDHWVANSMVGPEYDALRLTPELEDVRSFVACPVLVGDRMWGVLSFAAAIEYEYSELEIYSLRALANLAGVAFDTISSAADEADKHFRDGSLMHAVLSNEVVVATRHEMYDQLEIMGLARTGMFNVLTPLLQPDRGMRLTRRDVEFLLMHAKNLDEAHTNMNKVMETIKFAQSELKNDSSESVAVLDVWRRALEPFHYRLNNARVSKVVADFSPGLRIRGSSDWLRIVFMHLVLNSLDAFDRNAVDRGRREITLRLASATEREVTLRYVDNAGGIFSGSLTRDSVAVVGDVPHLIFQRYVTSKPKGTGLGLASCRAALEQMQASIDLIDWRRGVTFDIKFVLHDG